MAINSEADGAIMAAIKTLAERAADDAYGASGALQHATAANQLAEAHAWLRTAAQPHGGTTINS